MIKRYLILLLVLGLASAANAATVAFQVDGLTANGDGSYTLASAGAQSITINLYVSEAVMGFEIGALVTDGGGSAAGNPAAWDPGLTYMNPGFTLVSNPGFVENVDNGVLGTVLVDAASAANATAVAAGVMASFTYIIEAGWDGSAFTISGLTGDYVASDGLTYTSTGNFVSLLDFTNPNIAGVTINATPEPMTIALLGLGGLFLRRKK